MYKVGSKVSSMMLLTKCESRRRVKQELHVPCNIHTFNKHDKCNYSNLVLQASVNTK